MVKQQYLPVAADVKEPTHPASHYTSLFMQDRDPDISIEEVSQ